MLPPDAMLPHVRQPSPSGRPLSAEARPGDDAADLMAPILAGMRARAVADACERLALPAVLVDRSGQVLHVGRLAAPFLVGTVGLEARHLVGRTPRARRAVASALSEALGESVLPPRNRLLTGLPYADASPVQRLRGVIVLGRLDRDARRRMAALRRRLAAAEAVEAA